MNEKIRDHLIEYGKTINEIAEHATEAYVLRFLLMDAWPIYFRGLEVDQDTYTTQFIIIEIAEMYIGFNRPTAKEVPPYDKMRDREVFVEMCEKVDLSFVHEVIMTETVKVTVSYEVVPNPGTLFKII